ncbi:MAG: hypothetical protein NTY38_27895 [Acidobacteria bacterium]|nr:hypothetical protein [Acidobacteriota bacterium]
MSSRPEPLPPAKMRVASLDAFRGLVMTLMLAEVLRIPSLGQAFPGSAFWGFLTFNTSHVEWLWASLHDLIQPGFTLLVGASLPFSIAGRRAKGESFGKMLLHAAWRSLILIFLGVFLRSQGRAITNFTFEDTLSQIGLGYVFLFLLGFVPLRAQIAAFVLLLVGYWGAFALYPAPAPGFDYAAVGVPSTWTHHNTGFLAHWNKNSNLSWAFDTWFLNQFPREKPFVFNGGGYATLSFIPTLATMILGLFAGQWLKGTRSPLEKLRGLLVAAVALMLAGALCQWLGICPVVKRIWTPSWTLYSGGLVLLLISGFYALMEWQGWHRWSFPLMVVGMNSIASYVMAGTMEGYFLSALTRHFGHGPFLILGPAFEATLRGAALLAIFWGILYWMYRRKIFLRI